MFVDNSTSLSLRLASGRISDELAVAAVVIKLELGVDGDRLVTLPELAGATEADPPAAVTRAPLWHGVSVTAAGHAAGPPQAPFVCPVILRVGAAERRLIVFGERRWERRLGAGLAPSPALRFDRIALSFARAFGGGYDLPPGLMPGTELPHPGLRVGYPLNKHGIGYYPDERAAIGGQLPSIERPDQLVRHWNDSPEPAGFTPCPDLVAWRLKHAVPTTGHDDAESVLLRTLSMQHHAPPLLIFEDVAPGTPIQLQGLGRGPLRFVVPPTPARVSTVGPRKVETEVRPRLRGLHVDADRHVVCFIFAHTFHYHPQRPPRWNPSRRRTKRAIMSANLLDTSGSCTGTDFHMYFGMGPLGAPVPVPLAPHIVFWKHAWESREWRIATTVTTCGNPVLQSNWAMMLVVHVPLVPMPAHPIEAIQLLSIIAAGSATPSSPPTR